jgi:hypothetical protein
MPDKVEEDDNSVISVNFDKAVSLAEFDGIKEALYLDSEVNAPVTLNVVFKVHTSVSAQYGDLEDQMSPTLVIPIGSSVFKMEGQPEAIGENKIIENSSNRLPLSLPKLFLLFGFALISATITIITGLAKVAEPPDEFEKTIARIFKEYSERLAGMEHTISYEFSDVINVKSIEDMVKIGDEVGQPIFYYKVDSSMERKIEFFVFDNNRIYYMVLFGELKPAKERVDSVYAKVEKLLASPGETEDR